MVCRTGDNYDIRAAHGSRTHPFKLPCPSHLVRLASDRAHSILRRSVDTGVRNNLVFVMSDFRFGYWADVVRPSLQHVRVIGRKHCGCRADHGAEGIVKLLCLRLLNSRFEGWTSGSLGVVESRDVRMLVEVVVVIGGRAYNGALFRSALSSTD